jgi:hypothetical protein
MNSSAYRAHPTETVEQTLDKCNTFLDAALQAAARRNYILPLGEESKFLGRVFLAGASQVLGGHTVEYQNSADKKHAKEEAQRGYHQAKMLNEFIERRPEYFEECEHQTAYDFALQSMSALGNISPREEIVFADSLDSGPAAAFWKKVIANSDVAIPIFRAEARCNAGKNEAKEAEQIIDKLIAPPQKSKPELAVTPAQMLDMQIIKGRALWTQQRYAEAVPVFERACALASKPSSGPDYDKLGNSTVWMASCLAFMHRFDDAQAKLQQARETYTHVPKERRATYQKSVKGLEAMLETMRRE